MTDRTNKKKEKRKKKDIFPHFHSDCNFLTFIFYAFFKLQLIFFYCEMWVNRSLKEKQAFSKKSHRNSKMGISSSKRSTILPHRASHSKYDWHSL